MNPSSADTLSESESVPPDAPSDSHAAPASTPAISATPKPRRAPQLKVTWVDKVEAFISRLSVRDNFWHSICSFIWLPLAFFSGIRTKQLDKETFAAYLPFRRFNRNWYRAMAGGALLGNAEIAGGMYVFGQCGSDYTVVCKNLNYTFLRPCLGPAVYRMKSREDIKSLIATKQEFNCTLDMEVLQQPLSKSDRERRVGKCEVTFHITPKVHHKRKALRKTK